MGFEPEHWQKWLYDQLNERSIDVDLPILPEFDNPVQEDWLKELEKFKPFDDDTILVGHSLGCAAILRLLERLDGNQKVGKVILVSGWIGKTPKYPELNDFYQTDFNWKRIKERALKIIAVVSDNDTYHPFENTEKLAKLLGASLILKPNKEHINVKSGYGPFPEMLDLVLNGH